MTSLTDELEQNRRWKPRPGYQNARWFDELAENEFLSIGEQSRREQHALTQTVRSALACVPYYQTLFARLGLSADDVRAREDLSKLPVLTKVELFEHYHQLRANPLPAGERVAGHTRSSGTTGRPVTVALSDTATFMFAVLWHRAARWFRLDPQLTFAEIRLPSQLSSNQHRTTLGKGETAAWSAWRYLGKFSKPARTSASAPRTRPRTRWPGCERNNPPTYGGIQIEWRPLPSPSRMKKSVPACRL